MNKTSCYITWSSQESPEPERRRARSWSCSTWQPYPENTPGIITIKLFSLSLTETDTVTNYAWTSMTKKKSFLTLETGLNSKFLRPIQSWKVSRVEQKLMEDYIKAVWNQFSTLRWSVWCFDVSDLCRFTLSFKVQNSARPWFALIDLVLTMG